MTNTVLTKKDIAEALVNDGIVLFAEEVDAYDVAFARTIEQAVLQSPEVQAWRRDAERYRWLRSPSSVDILDVQHWDGGVLDGAALDDAIDTEMKEQP